HALAAFVNEKIAEVKTSTRTFSTHALAILAALNIADELFQAREQKDDLKKRVREKAQRIGELLDKVPAGLRRNFIPWPAPAEVACFPQHHDGRGDAPGSAVCAPRARSPARRNGSPASLTWIGVPPLLVPSPIDGREDAPEHGRAGDFYV